MQERKVTHVAVGVVIDPSCHRYLLGSRPEGKPYAGYWEFPGGKLEPDETVHEALVRELQEELDVTIGESLPWFVMEHDYPHAYVRLYFHRTWHWQGELKSLENQSFGWFGREDDVASMKLLPMDALIIERIFLPEVLVDGARADALALCRSLREQGVSCAVLATRQDDALVSTCRAASIDVLTPSQSVRTPETWEDTRTEDAQLWLCAVMPDDRGLDAGQHRAPVYVPGTVDGLDAVKRRGAHGVLMR